MPRNSYNMAECKKWRVKYTWDNGKGRGTTILIAPDKESAVDMLNNRLRSVGEVEIEQVRERDNASSN